MEFSATTLAKLRLIRTRGLGPKGIMLLLQRYASVAHAIENAAQWLRPNQTLASPESIEKEIAALQNANGWLVFYDDDAYPTALRDLPDAPVILTGLGNIAALQQRQVGVVGNRAASSAGLQWVKQCATELAQAGYTITSGLARGIDTAAHQGALATGNPLCTVAVIAGGIDNIYPPENAKLREAIIANGAVVTEQPWGMPPTANLFPQRNRIIAGLSLGVVVSEATRHSGSLITAEYALNYGREVFAVPGSPSDTRSSGPNWLLKQGATLIEGTADILQQLPATPAPYVQRVHPTLQPSLFATEPAPLATPTEQDFGPEDLTPTAAPPRTQLFALLSAAPTSFDVLVRQTGLPEAELNGLLIELELEGHATREADGRWRRG